MSTESVEKGQVARTHLPFSFYAINEVFRLGWIEKTLSRRKAFEQTCDCSFSNHLAVPTEFGGLGMSLAEVCREQRRLAYFAPATALAINMHLYWT
ncbi:MAG: hypothetical protein ACREOO_09190 [bacterium]